MLQHLLVAGQNGRKWMKRCRYAIQTEIASFETADENKGDSYHRGQQAIAIAPCTVGTYCDLIPVESMPRWILDMS